MAIEFFTGFEGCGSTADIATLFDVSDFIHVSASGFGGGKAARSGSTNGRSLVKYFSGAKTKVIGFHFNNAVVGSSSTINYNEQHFLVNFLGPNINFWINSTSSLQARLGRDGPIIATWNVALTGSAFNHIQIEVFSGASVGTIKVLVNGALVEEEKTGLNTGGSDMTGISIGTASSSTFTVDNIYLSDQIEGELVSILRKPASDASVQFTPSTGTDNYAMVDDMAQDGDTTYVESDTVGHVDTYEYEDVPSGYQVKAVSLVTVARKDDAGARTLQPVSVQDATQRSVGPEIVLATAYPTTTGSGAIVTLSTAPDSTEWSRSKVNDVKWGFKVAS